MANSSSKSSNRISNEEVFRRKLLMDGEGRGDDRRINLLMRNFFIWFDAKNQTEEQIQRGFDTLVFQLDQLKLGMERSKQEQEVHQSEILYFQGIINETERKIEIVKQSIADKKQELKEAERLLKNKQQYEELTREIAKLPDPNESRIKIKSIMDEINNLDKKIKALRMKLKEKQEQFKVLLGAVHSLKQSDNGKDEDINDE